MEGGEAASAGYSAGKLISPANRKAEVFFRRAFYLATAGAFRLVATSALLDNLANDERASPASSN